MSAFHDDDHPLRREGRVVRPLMDPWRNRADLSELENMLWGYYLGLSGELGLSRDQVTDMHEAPPDEHGEVLVTWWALADQNPPVIGDDVGTHVRSPGSPELWSGHIKLAAAEIAELRPRLGEVPTQEDADYFLEERAEFEEDWK